MPTELEEEELGFGSDVVVKGLVEEVMAQCLEE